MQELLKGVIDIHIHGSPAIIPRVETWDLLSEMEQAGYQAVGLKDHYLSTAGLTDVLNKRHGAVKTKAIGSLVFNNACGGLNLYAAEAAVRMGAMQLYFPTVSSLNHCNFVKTGRSFGGGGLKLKEKPIYLLKPDGSLVDKAVAIMEFVKVHPEIMLSTGHLSPEEISAVVDYAKAAGIHKLVIDHPYFITNASVRQVEDWAGKGAYINFTCSSLQGIGANGHTEPAILEQTLARVSEKQLLISTDFGQPYNGSPVIGMYRMIELLIKELKVPETRIKQMTSIIPGELVNVCSGF